MTYIIYAYYLTKSSKDYKSGSKEPGVYFSYQCLLDDAFVLEDRHKHVDTLYPYLYHLFVILLDQKLNSLKRCYHL